MSKTNQGEYHHLIDENCKLMQYQMRQAKFSKLYLKNRPGLTEFIRQSGLEDCQTHYNIISIIGSQNSGKSTLLNRVFGTNFEMLKGSSRKQTTKGIYVSRDKEKNIMILDVEGSNSRQRGKAEKGAEFYERSTALFALAFSQILIINCNSVNLGHESEYNIIKIIMEMNIRLFKSDQVKQLLIIIRDFNENVDNFDEICNSIRNEIYCLWSDVKKPPEFENVQPESLFQIDFFKSSHYHFERQKFEDEMFELRERFVNRNNPYCLFRGYNYKTNIPIEALEEYANALWETIQKNEDLNLPNQKLQASQIRCLKIKDQSIDLVSQEIQNLKQLIDEDYLYDFSQRAQAIVIESLKYYDKESQYYVERIRLDMRNGLNEELKQMLYPIFNQQIDQLQNNIKTELRKGLESLELQTNFFLEFMDSLKILENQIKQVIQKSIYQSLPFNEYKDDWKISKLQSQLNKTLKEMIDNARELQYIKFINQQEKAIKQNIDTLVSNGFDNLDMNFWKDISSGFNQIVNEHEDTIRNQISKHFEDDRIDQIIEHIHSSSYQFLQSDIQKRVRELPYYLLKKFKTNFIKDEKELTRKWKEIEEPVIQKLFIDSRKIVEDILQQFTRFKINLSSSSNKPNNNIYQSVLLKRHSNSYEQAQARQSLDNQNEDYTVLLETTQINKIKNQFLDEAEEEYNQVLRQRNSSFNGSIPKWIWFLLAFFMYDDVLRWMANPLFLYPILLFISFIGLCIASGYFILSILYQKVINKSLSQLTQQFSPLLLKLK